MTKYFYILGIVIILIGSVSFSQMMRGGMMMWWMWNSWDVYEFEGYDLPKYVYDLIEERIIKKYIQSLNKYSINERIDKLNYLLDKIEKARNKYDNLAILTALDYVKKRFKEELLSLSWDFNPNARKVDIVELKDGDTYTLEVTKVRKQIWNAYVDMLAYNWQIPWPLIKAPKWSTVTIRLVNKVKWIETTLHSHGVRLDNKYDWVPKEMRWQQDPVKFWEVFEYKINFKDEGIYWYHPHVREDMQQELGLYWNYLIEPIKRNFWSPVNREETLVLDDILIENWKVATFFKDYANYVWMGRYGNIMLVNGQTNYRLNVKKGEVIRFYITNVANTRVFNLSIPWAKIKLVWWDLWKYEREEYISGFVISPAERYVIEVYFPKAGEYKLINTTPYKTYTLATFNVNDNIVSKSYKKYFDILRVNDDVISDIDKYRKYFNKKPDKVISLTIWRKWMRWISREDIYSRLGSNWMNMMRMNMMQNYYWWIEWENTLPMNRMSNSSMLEWKIIDEKTKKENMEIDDWIFKVWDVVKIRIYNDSTTMHPMQHPIHFHWQRFLVVSRNWKPVKNLVWKDTVLVPIGEYVDILLENTNPWEWMAHCHIAEHLSAGMMMTFRVEP